jgi:hypothetical protein
MAQYIQTGVSLTLGQHERIRALTDRDGVTYTETIRTLVNIALPFAEGGHGVNYARLVTILEFTSLALDTLITKHAPEEADRLLDLAVEHLRKFHASEK